MDKNVFKSAFEQIEEAVNEFCREYCRYSDKDSDKFVGFEDRFNENSKCNHCPMERIV